MPYVKLVESVNFVRRYLNPLPPHLASRVIKCCCLQRAFRFPFSAQAQLIHWLRISTFNLHPTSPHPCCWIQYCFCCSRFPRTTTKLFHLIPPATSTCPIVSYRDAYLLSMFQINFCAMAGSKNSRWHSSVSYFRTQMQQDFSDADVHTPPHHIPTQNLSVNLPSSATAPAHMISCSALWVYHMRFDRGPSFPIFFRRNQQATKKWSEL